MVSQAEKLRLLCNSGNIVPVSRAVVECSDITAILADIKQAQALIDEMAEALKQAEELGRVGLLAAPGGLASRVSALRKQALAKYEEYRKQK